MTPKRKLVLDFIYMYIKVHGFAPAYKEIAQGLNLRSKSNIHRIVHELKEEGLLDIKARQVRSIKLKDDSVEEISKL